MTINELHTNLVTYASGLGDYQSMTKNQLAHGFCDADEAGDDLKKNAYWAAVLLRYWHWIWRWKENSASLHPSDEDLFSWLNDAIQDAFNYRSWREIRHDAYAEADLREKGIIQNVWIDNPQFVHDENAADKSINFFLGAKRGKMYQEANKDKRRVNVTSYSIDAMVDENGDCALDYSGAVEDDHRVSGAKELINRFLKDGYQVEAIILDGIINHDSFKETKTKQSKIKIDEETGEEYEEKYYDYDSSFDPRKLVKHINSINQEFMQTYFCNEYEITDLEGNAILEKLGNLNNGKIYNYIKKTLIQIKESPELLSYLLH